MITCKLGAKEYFIDYVSARAMREIDDASNMYARIVRTARASQNGEDTENLSVKDAMDVLVRWFCLLFNNQFTPDEFYDSYPGDRAISDIAMALVAVQSQATEVLESFPTQPTATERRIRRKMTTNP